MAGFQKIDVKYDDAYIPDDGTGEEYDDGFDLLTEEEEPEETEEERSERKRSRLRVAAGAVNLVAVIGGTVLILLLLTLLFNMINFVESDMSRNFSLFQTNF